ncbi:transcriptional regulator with XRE-family HTH domain [Sphingomonas jinjuensis]|uniref:Transcriptional regulator with XRE-family HTH domain n=1 Tax=Sphingomonas jinjuensis TaxID=535907 RepID=A0A840F8F2_9SPHN|nr:helix-turn-helix transcriptional regulator [Sphingomonas jinjuensis]MBB4152882.1 transcriptional regulator with XRE-family HTH domain [Sphingomonas jinjuensis]
MDADELKRRRNALGLTQAAFAERLGVHRDTINALERSARPITEQMALAIAALRPMPLDAKPKSENDLERVIETALIDAGIRYVGDRDGQNPSALDFRLLDFDVEIEVKRFYTARTGEQMARASNVIAVQGEKAVRFLAAAIRSGDFLDLAAAHPRPATTR